MQEQTTLNPIERQNTLDCNVLAYLIDDGNHRPMAVEEIERAIGKDTNDSLHRLRVGGLIHRLENFVWASRAAVMADEIKD